MNAWMLLGLLFAVVIGMVLPMQALINARLAELTSGPLFAAFLSFLVGTLALGAMLLFNRGGAGLRSPLDMPWWIWTGGLIGALFVFATTLLVPRLGAASMICLVVLGQVVGSLLLDHHGVLHAPRPADAMRVAGAVLVVVGAMLVVKPWQPA